MTNDMVPYNRMTQFQTSWSLDMLIKQLRSQGIDLSLRVRRTASNEINIQLLTSNTKRVQSKIDDILYRLYGVTI